MLDAEHAVSGLPAEQRLAVRQAHVKPLVTELENWMWAARARMSRHDRGGPRDDYMLKHWNTFGRFLDDGRIRMTTDSVEKLQSRRMMVSL